jgi:phage replication-related protein YjqB (UPF0714/DUF867 family)
MGDKFRSFEDLEENETAGVDYRILARQRTTGFCVCAPHGGGIEEGTSEIADAIAGEDFSFYTFEGLKPRNNAELHITSTQFDEPLCIALIERCKTVVTIHGQESTVDGDGVFIGGLDRGAGARIGAALENAGFAVHKHPKANLQGLDPSNICNRGMNGQGVQIEISRSVRRAMFSSLSPEGRKEPTANFDVFVAAVRSILEQQAQPRPADASA